MWNDMDAGLARDLVGANMDSTKNRRRDFLKVKSFLRGVDLACLVGKTSFQQDARMCRLDLGCVAAHGTFSCDPEGAL